MLYVMLVLGVLLLNSLLGCRRTLSLSYDSDGLL